eukprot:Gregarina_sp_Pseudo_9__2769@NODE_3005_length_787_cov_577_942513_g2743_i0_p1_GENE_NODE_3005_length_787_cov_577_942513_g2743_i0NODE_3005_length_787_cov_577_942513_g2743_i0_p1_ORF_typecomplete_len155_score25_83_NODE_3005_length_787_cov_577_942513_g2743_i0237701
MMKFILFAFISAVLAADVPASTVYIQPTRTLLLENKTPRVEKRVVELLAAADELVSEEGASEGVVSEEGASEEGAVSEVPPEAASSDAVEGSTAEANESASDLSEDVSGPSGETEDTELGTGSANTSEDASPESAVALLQIMTCSAAVYLYTLA